MITFSNLNETCQVYAIIHELSLIQISTPGNIIFILFCPKTVSLIDQPGKKRSLLFSDKFLTDFETKTIFQWPNFPRLSSRNLTFKTCLASFLPRLAWLQWITHKANLIRTLRVLMMQWEWSGVPHGGNFEISTGKTTSKRDLHLIWTKAKRQKNKWGIGRNKSWLLLKGCLRAAYPPFSLPMIKSQK